VSAFGLTTENPEKSKQTERLSKPRLLIAIKYYFHTIEGVDENPRKEEYLPLMMVA
jgi:hypothetical protein